MTFQCWELGNWWIETRPSAEMGKKMESEFRGDIRNMSD